MDTDENQNIRITENDLPQEFILKLLGQCEARGLWGIKNTREPVDVMVKYAKIHELSLPIVQLVITREGVFMSPLQCRLDDQIRENECVSKMHSRYISEREIGSRKATPLTAWNEGSKLKFRPKPSNFSQNALKRVKENYVECENKRTDVNIQKSKEENKEKFNCFISKKQEEKKVLGLSTDLRLLEKYSRFNWRKNGIFFFGIDTISYGVQDLIFTRVFSMIVISDRKNGNSGRGTSPFMCHSFVCESRSTAKRVTYALAAAFQAYGRSMKFLRGPEKISKNSYEEKPKKLTIQLRSFVESALNDSEA